MRCYTFELVIEKENGGTEYRGYSPTLPGCFCRAPTLEEARQSLRAAIQAKVAGLIATGQPIRQSDRIFNVAELTVFVPDALP